MRGASATHLVIRFLGSVRPGAPSTADDMWACDHLGEGEQAIWQRMSNPDRRHAVSVARAVALTLDSGESDAGESGIREFETVERGGSAPPVIAAALMHDSGKVISNYRTPMRVVATLVWTAVDHSRAYQWLERGRPFRRLAQYRLHPELGGDLLAAAGADEMTVHWAADHHRPPSDWRIPLELGMVLKSCDGD